MIVRRVKPADHDQWLAMRMALWPGCAAQEHIVEMRDHAKPGASRVTFVVDDGDRGVCGFVEASLRDVAEGSRSTPVGYLEGIYVRPDRRRNGIGRALVAAVEEWAVARGCLEMASDCDADNLCSKRFHCELGYEISATLLHLRRSLGSSRQASKT